ncbi:hypothetical protein FOZ61_003056 [Perkinsus olseni]|uniref:Guanylate cyclase domain-containing protein n=1 Tax=Perkinsus olseni TaxID=32597 RepID=A0A7J6LRZ9_PEROL|nr:hypothetical protein FOZ61_003056 [Perkinsus olseni]
MRLFRSRKSSSTEMEHQAGGSIYSVEGRASSLEHGPAVMDGGPMRVTNRGSTSTLNGTAEVKNSGASDPPEWDAFPLPPPRGKGALIRWDFSVVSLLPWTLRIPLRLHDCKNPKNGKLYCKWDAVLYDKLNRHELWARHGQSMHWLTLEFENPGLEKGYESLHNRYPEATFGRVLLAEPLNALIYLGLIHFTIVSILVREPSPPPRSSSSTASLRASHESYFQAFQSCFAWFTTTLALLWMYLGPELIAWYTWPMDEASTFCILLLVTACLYRLRFILMVAVSVYQIVLFVALRASFPTVAERHGEFFDLPTDPVIMVVSALFMAILTYSLEVLGRKDFVQSLMVTIESQRSDRLLRNVLPKRIIDTLKERQQQDLSAVSVCNTARSTAAGQLLAQTNCGQSNYLHVPNGVQQQGGYAISSQNSAAFTMQIAAASSQAQLLTGKSTKRSGVPHSRSFAGIAATAAAAAAAAAVGGNASTSGLYNSALAEFYSDASILFADVVGFTSISSRVPPEQVLLLLNELFFMFDNIAEKHGLEKIKTIGDAYMAAAGLPTPHPLHAHAVARMGLDMVADVGVFCDDMGNPLALRVGCHSGSCVAGVIGRKKFIYDVWGDCVNTASRMESHGEPMKVHCSEATAQRIQGDFELVDRGDMFIKGKGLMRTFFIEREMESTKDRSVLPNKKTLEEWRDRLCTGANGSLCLLATPAAVDPCSESPRRESLRSLPAKEALGSMPADLEAGLGSGRCCDAGNSSTERIYALAGQRAAEGAAPITARVGTAVAMEATVKVMATITARAMVSAATKRVMGTAATRKGYKAGGNGNSFYKKSWSGNKFGGFTKPALPINQFYYTDPQANGKNIRLKLDFGNVVRNPEASGNNPMKLVLTQPAEGDTPAKVNEFSVGWKGAGQILALNFRDPEAMSGVEALSAAEGSAEGGSHARIGQNKGHLMIEVTSPEGEPIRCRVPPAQGVAIQALLRYSLPKMVPRTTPIEPSAP